MNKKLNTEDIKFMIPDYISGMLNDADKALVYEAIRDSVDVREFYNDMKSTFGFVSTVKFDEPSQQYWNSLLPRIHDKIEIREQKGFSWDKIASLWKVLVPIAAVILIALVYYIVKPSNTQFTEEKKTEQIKNDSSNDGNNNIKENIKQDKVPEDNNGNKIANERNDNNSIKKNMIRKYSVKPDNSTSKNIIPESDQVKETRDPVKDEQLAAEIEETSIFADGEGAGFDEETENDLKKLNDNEKETLLKELENTNL